MKASASTGFPVARVRSNTQVSSSRSGKMSVFARRHQQAQEQIQSKDAKTTQSHPHAHPHTPPVSNSAVQHGRPHHGDLNEAEKREIEEAEQEAVSMFDAMSHEEKVMERQKLLQSLPPELLQKWKALNMTDNMTESSNGFVSEHAVSASSKPFTNHIEHEDEKASEISIPTKDASDSTPVVDDSLNDGIDMLKMEWAKDLTHLDMKSPNHDGPSKLRFDFNGSVVSERSANNVPVHSGLYHHGEEAGLPGYTIAELCKLSRSSVLPQRLMAFNSLSKILRRLRKHSYHILGIQMCLVFDNPHPNPSLRSRITVKRRRDLETSFAGSIIAAIDTPCH